MTIKKPTNLPGSRSKEFWGDSQIIKCEPEPVLNGQIHRWKQQGSMAQCTECPNPHGIFLDILNQEVRNGEIVDIKTGNVLYGRARSNTAKG